MLTNSLSSNPSIYLRINTFLIRQITWQGPQGKGLSVSFLKYPNLTMSQSKTTILLSILLPKDLLEMTTYQTVSPICMECTFNKPLYNLQHPQGTWTLEGLMSQGIVSLLTLHLCLSYKTLLLTSPMTDLTTRDLMTLKGHTWCLKELCRVLLKD